MHDYYGTGIHTHQHIINVATQVAKNYGCTEISTPILESTHLFQRGLGESSEVIVGKELYSFTDSKGEREVALRPEGTAGVMRALAQHELQRETHRLYYSGPFFRRERPQKGRYRQFHQFGVEQFGFQDTFSEVDMISMGNMLLEKLKVASKLKIHTIGNVQERSAFVKELHFFLLSQKEQLSLLSQSRLDTNPLRILDSKLPQDINALNKAPLLIDFLGQESRTHFEAIQSGLKSLNIPYEIDHKLVRGLDYYQHTVWEFVSNHPALGNSQSTVLAGGRYDGLLEKIGCLKSSSKPAMGWACGIERLALVASVSPRITKSVLMVSLSTPPNQNDQSSEQNPHQKAHQLAYSLRLKNIPTVHHPLDSLSKRLPGLLKASSTGTTPTHLVVIGTSELETGYLKVKCLFTRSESSVSIEELASYLQSQLQQD